MPDLTIIVPCYMDAPHLERNTNEIIRVLRDTCWRWEILLVNDRSPDESGAIADALEQKHGPELVRAVHHGKNLGRGAAVMTGLRLARGKVAGFIDIDLEVHARYIPSLVRAVLDGAHVAVAHRIYRLQLSLIHRTILSRGYLRMANWLLGTDFADSEAGFKFFLREEILPVLDEMEHRGWFWDTEILMRARRAGMNIAFIPALFLRDPAKRSTVRLFRDTLDYFRALLEFRQSFR